MTVVSRNPVSVAALAAARLDAARAAALQSVFAWIDAASVPLTGGVPLQEIMGWAPKEAAAVAVLAGTATAGQQEMIAAEIAMTGETEAALCATIIAKASAYHQAVGVIAGLRRRAEIDLAAAETEAECQSIVGGLIAQAGAVLAG